MDDPDLLRQHSPLMSPLVWDLAHIGNQEELWLLRDVAGRDPLLPETVDQLYDAFQHARGDRPALPLLEPAPSGSTWPTSAVGCWICWNGRHCTGAAWWSGVSPSA